ncbi:MAG: type VI secretion system protein TssA [Ectothiorhodospiraceae bacterium]|nr:type VI secretion system protein TssA [Ectothiorhodospiraceae bacterium]
MSSPILIDINTLLEPISEDSPVGVDLRENPSASSLYAEIKDARNSARAAERNSMFDGGSSEAQENWSKILTLAPTILASESKDLEIACWYTEALIRKSGYAGLRNGFALIRQLIKHYWHDGLFPAPDEDGIETRVASISGLNGEGSEGVLLAPIRSTHITDDIHPGPFSLWQYKQAIDITRISDNNSRSEQTSKVGFSMEDIENVVEQSSSEYFVALQSDINACLTEYRAISTLLLEHCGSLDAPATSKIIELLEESLGAINHIAKHKFPVAPEPQEPPNDSEITELTTDTVAPKTGLNGAPTSRQDAFRQLASLSEYFRKTEPHSPISYVLDKAVKWGDMNLDELMNELIPDSSSRTTYSSLTGVKTNDD